MSSPRTDPASTDDTPFTAAVVAREEAGIRAESFLAFSERLAIEIDVEDCAEVALREMAAFAGASAGAISLADGNRLTLVATLGVEQPLVRGLEPLAAVSLATDHELRIRLVHGYEGIGTVLLGRNGAPFGADDLAALEHLGDQAAIALGKLLALRHAVGHATLNHAVLDSIDEAVLFADVKGRLLVTNSVAQQFADDFGVRGGDVWEQLAAFALGTTDIAGHRAFAAALAADPELSASHEYEQASSGRSFVCRSGPVRDADGELIGRIFATRETTAERAAERLRDDLVANVSHELRTPLTSILGYIDLLGDEGPLDETQRSYLAVVERNARRLLRRVDELLFLAHAESGTVALELEDVDVHALAVDAVETALPLAAERETALTLAGEGPLVVRGDPARLGQLADNLLGNALKYTPGGGSVEVSVERRGDHAVLAVADSGIGIAPDDLERIFDRFYRASRQSARMAGGSGLGLAISKAIVDAHGGTIAVTSSGAGSTFTIRLPLLRDR